MSRYSDRFEEIYMPIPAGTKVRDHHGDLGIIVRCLSPKNTKYTVRFEDGDAIRFVGDLTVIYDNDKY